MAVLDKRHDGIIWTDSKEQPSSAMMICSEGFFIAGDPDNSGFNNRLRKYMLDLIKKKHNPVTDIDYLYFYIGEGWETYLEQIFPTRIPFEVRRLHYTIDKEHYNWKEKLGLFDAKGYQLHQIDKNFDEKLFEIDEDVVDWIDGDLELMKQLGFATCITHHNRMVVISTADCATEKKAEIGIFTTPDHRGKGLAAIASAAAVSFSLNMGYKEVGWHCEGHNHGSVAVAEKIGFTLSREYLMFIALFDELKHTSERAMMLYFWQRYQLSTEVFEKAMEIGELDPWFYQLAARSNARSNNPQRALDLLRKAIEKGWDDLDAIRESDDFASLLERDEWKELLGV